MYEPDPIMLDEFRAEGYTFEVTPRGYAIYEHGFYIGGSGTVVDMPLESWWRNLIPRVRERIESKKCGRESYTAVPFVPRRRPGRRA